MAHLNGSKTTPPCRLVEPRGALDSGGLRGALDSGGRAPGADDEVSDQLSQELDEEMRRSGIHGCCRAFARLGPGGGSYLTDGLFAMALRKSALCLGYKVLVCVFWTPSAGFAGVVAGAFAGRAGQVGDLRRLVVDSLDSFMQLTDNRDFAWFVGCLRRAEALKQFWADGGDAGRQALPQLAAGLMAATLIAFWHLTRFEWVRYEERQALWSTYRHLDHYTLLEYAGVAKRVLGLLRPPAGAPGPDYDQMLADACKALYSYVYYGREGTLMMALAYMVDNTPGDYAAVYGLPGLLATVRHAAHHAARGAAEPWQRPELAGQTDDEPAARVLQGLGPQLRAYVHLRFLVLRALARAVRQRKAAALAQITMMPPGGPFPGGEGFHASAASYHASAASYHASAASARA